MAESHYICGLHAVRHALAAAPERALELWVQERLKSRAADQLLAEAERCGVATQRVPTKTLAKLADDVPHQGVVLRQRVVEPARQVELPDLVSGPGPALLLVLDGVQDPRNLGACLRTANAAGAHGVVAPVHRGVGMTPTVRKAASGAAELTPLVRVRNLAQALAQLKELGVWLVGTSEAASASLYETDLTGPIAIVLGSEDKGMRRLTKAACDIEVQIPMAGQIESLNLGVASGIALFEAVRQRSAQVPSQARK